MCAAANCQHALENAPIFNIDEALESWQQRTGLAVAKRLLVASMACVTIWRIAHAKGAKAGELRKLLVRLSGRQMKWKIEFTYPALLAGMWTLLSILDFSESFDISNIRTLLSDVLEKQVV